MAKNTILLRLCDTEKSSLEPFKGLPKNQKIIYDIVFTQTSKKISAFSVNQS
jgi:hypothetical protein